MHTALKAWFPYRSICRTKKIHRTDTTLWKPPVQLLNTIEMTDTTCCTRWNEFYLSYEFFSYNRHDRYNDMETRLKWPCLTVKNEKTFRTELLDIFQGHATKVDMPLVVLKSISFGQKSDSFSK